MGAAPSGRPGWPLSAFCTMSTERKRSVSMQRWSREAAALSGAMVLLRCLDVGAAMAAMACLANCIAAMAAPTGGMWVSSGAGERRVHDPLRLGEDRLQVVAAFEAFAVDLVDVLGARRPRGEPAVVGNHLDAADRGVVAGGLVQYLPDRRPGERVRFQLGGCELRQRLLLLRAGRRLDAVEERLAEGIAQAAVVLGGIVAVARGEFGREQRRRHAVLVGGPHRAVAAQETGARALLAAQPQRAVEQPVGKPLEPHRRLVQLAS